MNLLIICIFILNILLILQVIYYFKEFKSNSKKIKKLVLFIVFGFMLLPIKTFALETLFIGNGTVLNRCTSNVCAYPYSGTTNYRAALNNMSFNIDEEYTFNLNFNATTAVASPNLTDCGLNVNGAYVSPQSRNSGRTTYECNQGYTRCDSSYVSTIVWKATSNLSDVSVFIQCDMTPQSATYTQTRFSATVSSSNGSINQTMLDVGNSIIETNNYNANQNNANRDSNSAMIGGKIDNNTNVIGGKLDSHANTISGKLQQLIDNLTSFGSNIVNAIGTGINNIISGISNFFTHCEEKQYIYNSSNFNTLTSGYLDVYGNVVSSVTTSHTDFIYVKKDSRVTISTTGSNLGGTSSYCKYDKNKNLIYCEQYQGAQSRSFTTDNDYYYRFSVYLLNDDWVVTVKDLYCKPFFSFIISKITGFFDSFINFVSTLFDNTIGNVWNQLNEISTIQDTPVTDLILMPLTLIEALHTAITSNTCSGYTIPFDFTGGNNILTLPCLNLQNYLGSTLWSAIDLILMGLMIYSIGQMVVSFFESWSSLHDTFDYLYNVGPNNKG